MKLNPTPNELPSEESKLADLAGGTAYSEEQRKEAFQRLVPKILWVAKRVSSRFVGCYRDEVIENAAGDIWLVIGHFPAGGNFESWCYTVLKHKWLESIRQNKSRQLREQRVSQPVVADVALRQTLEKAMNMDAVENFARYDMAIIVGWPHRDRLVLLSLAGLWQKVPYREWQNWVCEHREKEGVPDDPFPPELLALCEQLTERNAVLATALNLKRSTLSVLLYRGKARLLKLRYIRDRLESSTGGIT